ncbi:hypothetical protein NQ318_020050 [Aromia moschata]|uniref:Alpha-SNAP n=1 Tax=Aromia moschata TaxID=1265417 RepID=A0AAV8Z8Z4_9CUCU|nr:hypothetical protein NQ318_020050 [Aromia moschata]
MTHIELKARQLRDEAEKKLNPRGFFKTLFSKTSHRVEESTEYYSRAGNLFKMAKNWSQAGYAFADAADLNLRNSNRVEAAINYVEAANCFKKTDVSRAVEFYLKAIEIYCDKGKFVMGAKYHQAIAELLEDESDGDDAVGHYEKAAELYKQECNFSSANKCLEKIGERAALDGDYHKAVGIFQEIACFDLASSVLRYCAKQYLFRAAICLLCSEADVGAKMATYVDMYPAFEESREYRLVVCLLECVERGDGDRFAAAVRKYDSASKLGQWHAAMLQRARKRIAERPDLR